MGGIIEMLTASPELYRGKFFTATTNDATSLGIADPVSGPNKCVTLPPVGVTSILTMFNSASRTSGTGKNTILIPMYLKIRCTTVGTSGTSSKFVVGIDVEDRSGAATSLAVAMNPRQTRAGSNSTGAVTQTTSKATIWSGNITMNAATGTWRQIGFVDWRIASASFVAGDEITIAFGDTMGGNVKIPTAANAYRGNFGMAPIFIEPQCSMTVQQVSAAQTSGSFFEFQLAWAEVKNDSVA
jgi:hypothetical protein